MTDHVHNQLCARIEELEKEKLELNEQLDIAQQERDTLAAHLEEAKSTIGEWRSGAFGDTAAAMNLEAWRASCPETSLVRRDLLKQAEVPDEASNEFEVHERARMVLHWKAQKIRQQAEGGGR